MHSLKFFRHNYPDTNFSRSGSAYNVVGHTALLFPSWRGCGNFLAWKISSSAVYSWTFAAYLKWLFSFILLYLLFFLQIKVQTRHQRSFHPMKLSLRTLKLRDFPLVWPSNNLKTTKWLNFKAFWMPRCQSGKYFLISVGVCPTGTVQGWTCFIWGALWEDSEAVQDLLVSMQG